MSKVHKLYLVNENSLIPRKFSKEEKKEVWNKFGPDPKVHNFSWANEDYRQSIINPNIEDAVPKESDFLPFPFRHLSATIVGGGSWKATEFPEKVLKAATKMLANRPVYVNHELEISNIVAGIGETTWTPSFKMEDGTIVPGGIDAPIWVDAKLHPDLCRKLAAFPVPHIQSVSVTVVFEWEPSHVFENREGVEDLWLFENRIGQVVDGEMVRRIATKIVEFYETSLVWLGADPFAKILDEEGKPLNIEKSAIVGMEKFDKDPLTDLYKKENKFFISESCISNDKKLDLVKRIFKNDLNNGNLENNNETFNNTIDMEIVKLLAQRLNLKPEEITADLINSFEFVKKDEHTLLTGLKAKVESVENYDKIVGERDQFKADLDTANQTIETNKPLVEFANTTLESSKEQALKFYRLSLNGKEENPASVKLIERAFDEKDFEAMNAFIAQYGGDAIAVLSPVCECGSKNITFRSSEEKDGEEINLEGENKLPDLVTEYRKNNH